MYPATPNRFVFQNYVWGPHYLQYVWSLLAIYASFQVVNHLVKLKLPTLKKPDVFSFYVLNIAITTAAAYYFVKTTVGSVLGSDSFFLYANDAFGATNLIVALYMCEVMMRNKVPTPLLVHHLVTVVMIYWGFMMRNEPQMDQLLIMLLFAALEQPCQIGMICYRIGSPTVQKIGLWFALIAFGGSRVVNLVAVILLAIKDWKFYDPSFKVVYPIFVGLILWAQCMTITIYCSLLQRIYRGSEVVQSEDNEIARQKPKSKRKDKNNYIFAFIFAMGLVCSLIVVLLPSPVSLVPYWLDGSHNHPYFPDSGKANNSYQVQGLKPPSTLPPVAEVCRRILNRTLFSPALDINQRSLFHISLGQFASHDLMATTQDMQRIPIFVGQTPEETAWPWIDNNEQSTWLDLSNLYGTTPEILSYIRNQSHPCKLRLDKNGNLLRENGKLVTGDQRAGQSPYLIGWHMLFTKEHNWQCDILAQKFPSMDADVLFYRAREATILVFQKFLVNEYVPGYSGEGRFRYLLSDRSMDYFIAEKNIKSSNLFNILYRLHTMIPDTIKIIDARGILVDTYSIDQVYYNTTLMTKYGLDALLRGSMWTPAYRYGRGYPTAMTTSRFNLCEIDFIRARERELGSYINTRKMYASNPTMSFYDPSVDWTRQLTEWSNFTSVPAIQNALEELYGNVENVELLAGAYLDNESEAASFGGIAYAVLLEEANTVIRGDRWSILNFDTAPRDFDWQNQLISTSYSRNIYDFVKQHTGMPCLPLDVMRVGEGQLVC